MVFKNRLVLLLSILFFTVTSHSYDWEFYSKKYPELYSLGIKTDFAGLVHFIQKGFIEGRQAAPNIQNTNFDWQYYKEINKLPFITTENAVKNHYLTIGRTRNLPFCKRFTIGIFVHLYDLTLIDEIIEKINYFIKINNFNNFYIKISIPLANNIGSPLAPHIIKACNKENYSKKYMERIILQFTPYHKHLITSDKIEKLFSIFCYLRKNIALSKERIQLLFCENRGLDVGGFFLLMDQTFKENLQLDYVVKIHSKTNPIWRTILTSLLNLRINKILRTTDSIYTCKLNFNWANPTIPIVIAPLTQIFNYFNVPKKNFNFPAGTMFITSSKILNFFRTENMLALYNKLTYYNHYASNNVGMEHGFEWFFGYLITYLKLQSQTVGYIPRVTDRILEG